MIYAIGFGLVVLILLGLLSSSMNARKVSKSIKEASETQLKALREEQELAELNKRIELRKASLFDALRKENSEQHSSLSDNQLLELIEVSLRTAHKLQSGALNMFLGWSVIFIVLGGVVAWYFWNWWVFGASCLIGGALAWKMATSYDARISKDIESKGIPLERLSLDR